MKEAKSKPRKKSQTRSFVPVTAEDVTDIKLLPKRFDFFEKRITEELKLLGTKILPALIRVEELVGNHGARLLEIERALHKVEDRIAAIDKSFRADLLKLEARITALKAKK